MGYNKSVRLCIVQKTFWINFDGSLICFDNIAHLTIKGNSIRSRGKNKLTLLLVPGCEEQCLHNICCSNSLDIKLLLPEIYHTEHTFSNIAIMRSLLTDNYCHDGRMHIYFSLKIL